MKQPETRKRWGPAAVLATTMMLAGLAADEARAQPAADPRPSVDVRVVAAEPDVRDDFGEETSRLEALVADGMVKFFADQIRFLRFTTGAQTGSDVVLTLTLGSESAPPLLHRLDLEAQISGTAVVEGGKSLFIEIRDEVAAARSRGTVGDFAGEIVEQASRIDHQTWVGRLFHLVVVGSEAHAFQDPSGWHWALPFRLDEMGTLTSSQFAIDSELTIDGNPKDLPTFAIASGHVGADNQQVPEVFRSKAMARVTKAGAALMGQASACRSKRILVEHYVRDFQQQLEESSGADLDLSLGVNGGSP